MDWTNIITAVVALYGAVLSTYMFITQLRKEKFRIKVKITMGFMSFVSGSTSNAMVFLSASNPGQKAVVLSAQGFMLPDKRSMVFPNAQTNVTFPYELLPAKSCQIWIEAREIAETLKSHGFSKKVKLIGFYRDQLDKVYKSKPYKFDIDEWGKAERRERTTS
jgi:hypothetical protein